MKKSVAVLTPYIEAEKERLKLNAAEPNGQSKGPAKILLATVKGDVHDIGNRYEPMKAGMVFTCEPGIYIPEEGLGIRLENDILITSDTIVWLNEKALGKPKDYDDAFKMLQALANQTQEVITSVCIKTSTKIETFHCVTKVTFATLAEEHIRYYLDQYKPFDKAGSYGIQDWIGLIGIEKIEGSYTNVVGLPTEMLFQKLMHYV